jgi:two-component system response regulator AtoC
MNDERYGETTVRGVTDIDLEPSRYTLVVMNESGVDVTSLPTAGAVIIGRGAGADVRIRDSRISRRHACIHVGSPFAIEDLHSANGTSVGNHRLASGRLHAFTPGDVIRAGSTTMLVRGHAGGAPAVGRPHGASNFEHLPGDLADDEATSDIMKSVVALADRAAASMLSVLLLGETGVGKDVLAERIHRASPRGRGPFLRLNCAALSPTLFASELFGHEKGAYTGATSSQPGLLQSANGGTVFFDEVGDLPLDLQAKLLIVLERREVHPIGAVRPRQIDVRFIAATNRPLLQDVAAGRFRTDLYHRLNGVTIEVPPLRARREEIDNLARRFAADAARSIGIAMPSLECEVLAALLAYSWPGNLRELRTVVERAVLLGTGDSVRLQDIIFADGAATLAKVPGCGADVSGESEKQQIVTMLAQCGWNQSRAAKMLGISRNTLIARIERYGLARPLRGRSRA